MQNVEDIKQRFDEYYWRNIYPLMITKEKIRLKYVARLKKLLIIACVIIPLLVVFASYFTKSFESSGDFIVNIAYLIITITVFILRGPFILYKKIVKDDIMDCFIKFFDGFKYEPKQGLTAYDIRDSYIFPKFDDFSADDCFSGLYNGVAIRICEEKLIRYTYMNKKRRKQVVFLGVVLELDMNKNFNYHTFVTKDKGIFNHLNGKRGFERVALEDVVFEKEFEAYSQNQVEARYLLTTAFMERMLKLKELYKGKSINFSFLDSKVLIAINTKENMFEPCKLLKTNLQQDQVYKVFEQFITIFSVVDMLKLSQRIGM